MQLNAPLVVPTDDWKRASGAVELGIPREVAVKDRSIDGKPIEGTDRTLPKTAQYVRVWKPGQTDRGRSTPPRLVRYYPRDSGVYGSPVPALLCSSLKAAAEVFAWCEGYAKCAHCGKPFTPTRKDQTCCTPQHSALERVNRKRTLDRAAAQRRKSR